MIKAIPPMLNIKTLRLVFVTLAAFFVFYPCSSFAQTIYQHDFGATAISSHPYIDAPSTIDVHLGSSSWSNSEGSWSSGAGASGEAIQLNSTPAGTTITLDIAV